ncbi:MAG: MFS transporter [Holophagales bacterium]|nr:MFS transporter [Holophagales bacterium]
MLTRLRSLLARAVELREGEGPALGWASAYFFLLLASYYVIRPLRDEMGVRGSENALSWLFVGTLAGTAALNPLFGALVSRLTRKVFVPVVYHVLVGTLAAFWALLSFAPPAWHLPVAQAFFIWASIFNLFAVSVFWGFLADLFRPEQGQRLFGFVAVGGTLGAVAGAALTAGLAGLVGPTNLILLAALLLEGAVACVHGLVRHFGVDDPSRARTEGEREPEGVPPGSGVLSGLSIVSRSGYLLAISLFLLLFAVSSTFLYFEQARIVKAALADSAQRTAFFARIDLWVNLLAAFTQVFLSGRIVRALGVGGTLVALPVLTAAGFVALAVSPTTGVLVLVMVSRRAGNFALFRPAREVLFTVLPREEKYAAKNFVDTFVYRFGDVVGAFADKGLRALGAMGATLAGLFLPVAVAWALLAAWLGRRQARLAAARAGVMPPAAPATGTPQTPP